MRRGLGVVLLGAAVAMLMCAPAARAAAPLGACCLRNGSCQDIVEFLCDQQGGEFFGAASCATVDCAAPVGAPLVSIFGLVAVAGALGGLGLYRLLVGRASR